MADVTLEQIHQDMRAIREKLDQNNTVLAKQDGALAAILQRLDQFASIQAQQSAQINVLTTQLEVTRTKLESNQAQTDGKFQQLFGWQARAQEDYIPRKEHMALNLEKRIKDLEDAQEKTEEKRTGLTRWVVDHGITIVMFIINCIVLYYVSLHH